MMQSSRKELPSRESALACSRNRRRPAQASWSSTTSHGSQPSAALEYPQGGCATLPDRSRRSLHQQPSGARRTHDEGQAEDLWRLSSEDGANTFVVNRTV